MGSITYAEMTRVAINVHHEIVSTSPVSQPSFFCLANHNDLFSQKVQCLLSSFYVPYVCMYWHFFHSPDTATYLEREAVAIVDCF